MNRIHRFSAPAAVLGLALLALPGLSAAQSSWFFGGGFGHASIDESGISDNDTSFKLLGGFNFNPNFAIEGLYTDFGEFTGPVILGTRTAVEGDGFGLGVRGEIPLGTRFGLYGRVGAFFWDATAKTTGTPTVSVDDSGTDVYFGVGGRLKFNEAVSIFLDFDRFSLDPADVDMWTLGLQFDFGRR